MMLTSISMATETVTIEPQVVLDQGKKAPFSGVLIKPVYFDYYQIRDKEAQIYQEKYEKLLDEMDNRTPVISYILAGAAAIVFYEGARSLFLSR